MKIDLREKTAHLPLWAYRLPTFAMGRILTGRIREPRKVDFSSIMESKSNECKTGFEMLSYLVREFRCRNGCDREQYYVSRRDKMQGHYDLSDLRVLLLESKNLPDYFKEWAYGKNLYAWRSVIRFHGGRLFVPYLNFKRGRKPIEGFSDLADSLGPKDIPLCDHVFPRE